MPILRNGRASYFACMNAMAEMAISISTTALIIRTWVWRRTPFHSPEALAKPLAMAAVGGDREGFCKSLLRKKISNKTQV